MITLGSKSGHDTGVGEGPIRDPLEYITMTTFVVYLELVKV